MKKQWGRFLKEEDSKLWIELMPPAQNAENMSRQFS